MLKIIFQLEVHKLLMELQIGLDQQQTLQVLKELKELKEVKEIQEPKVM